MKKLLFTLWLLLLAVTVFADITPLPDPPARTDPANFATKADAFLGALPTFATEANALATEVNGYKTAAEAAQIAAEAAQAAAASSANFKGDWSDQTGAAAIPYSVFHEGNCWNLVNPLADVTASEPGATADWVVSGGILVATDLTQLQTFEVSAGTVVYLKGRTTINDGGQGVFVSTTADISTEVTADTLNGIYVPFPSDPTGGDGGWVRQGKKLTPYMFGYTTDVSLMTTTTAVADNWSRMDAYLTYIDAGYEAEQFSTFSTLKQAFAEWYAGRSFPIGFYSDSTTDGATTVDHVSSTGSTTPFGVTINESPNAYPAKIEEYVKAISKSSSPVRCYNGGFDSQSYLNGFGLRQWYNTWFRGLDGSNVDWSDVKMIVLGFGTSDSINLDDPGSVLDTYTHQIESTIIDCLLRGIQPVLQGPVWTTQEVGSTLSYRHAKESLILIEQTQQKLARKYNLEWISMRKPMEEAVKNFAGLKYSDMISATDMVHPSDMGHRVYASWFVKEQCDYVARIPDGSKFAHIVPGDYSYITTYEEIISPVSKGGLILKRQTSVVSDSEFYYAWEAADGNQKDPEEFLIRIALWVDRPTALYINTGRGATTTNRKLNFVNKTYGTNSIMEVVSDTYSVADPSMRSYNHKELITFLPYGLTVLNVFAGNSTDDWDFNGIFLKEFDKGDFTPGRGTSGGSYYFFQNSYPDNPYGYTAKLGELRPLNLSEFYNPTDNVPTDFVFDIIQPFGAGVTYQFHTHFRDWLDYQDTYNLIEILGDVVTLKVNYGGAGEATIDSQTIAGLNVLLTAGASVDIRYTTKFYLPGGVVVQLIVNGTTQYSYTASLGVLVPSGYGFEYAQAPVRNVSVSHREIIRGYSTTSQIY